jgi:hypothetical protein
MLETTTGTSAVTITILPNGQTRMSSSDPFYRLFKAIVDLFLDEQIDFAEFYEAVTPYLGRYADDEIHCPAARALYGNISLAWMEPSCICIANWDGPPCIRGCEPLDRRARLRELIYGV